MLRVAFLAILCASPVFSAEIYVPETSIYVPQTSIYVPNFQDLRQPSTTTQTTPGSAIYSNPSITYPQQYYQYQYYYGNRGYNYRMQQYPYMAYNGNGYGARNMQYFMGQQQQRQQQSQADSSNARFSGARFFHSKAKAADNVEGKISRQEFLKAWMQIGGLSTMPPAIASGEVVAIMTTKDLSKARIIQSASLEEKDNNKKVLKIVYKIEDKSTDFYQDPEDERNGFISAAIFKEVDAEVQFVNANAEQPRESNHTEDNNQDDRDDADFMDQGSLSFGLLDWKAINDRTSGGALNYTFKSRDELDRFLDKYKYEDDPAFENLIEQIDFDSEILYVTGRIFPNKIMASRLSSRKLSTVRAQSCSSGGIMHQITIEEDTRSARDLHLSDKSLAEKQDFWFEGYYILHEKPRDLKCSTVFISPATE
jgi:hypothetical protein